MKLSLTELSEIATKFSVRPHEIYKHNKTGNLYIVVDVGFRENDLVPLVAYKRAGGSVTFFREMKEFLNKFTLVDQEHPYFEQNRE